MILPYFDYADVIYHKSNSGDLNELQQLQNRCLRVCLGYERFYSTERARKLSATPFPQDRCKSHVLNFMFNRKKNSSLLNKREIRTRSHDAPFFNVKFPRCEAFKRSVGYFGSESWNALDPATRNTKEYLAFKHLQKKRDV